jgi:hypothetical protein
MKLWPVAVCLMVWAVPCIAQSSASTAPARPDALVLPANNLTQPHPLSQPDLPDAPTPTITIATAAAPAESESTFLLPDVPLLPSGATLAQTEDPLQSQPGPLPAVALKDCPYTAIPVRECRVRWGHLAIEASLWLAFQNAGNVYTSYTYRVQTIEGKWWDRYVNSVEGWRWDRWSDNNPFLDAYIAHPIMGSITNYIWIQNDPRSMTVTISNTPEYWNSRLRALAFSTFYSFEWKLGPIGEASIGHNGDHYFYDQGVYTNETGWVELVTTPIGGALWSMTEDLIDQRIITRLEQKSSNPFALLAYGMLNPTRSVANMLRFRPPWYRDSRIVRAKSFWTEPGGGTNLEDRELDATDPSVSAADQRAAELPVYPHYGGVHEFGAWWGLSLMTGHIWGFAKDVKYMPIDVRYSYLVSEHPTWQFRYSPELTALAMIDWPTPGNSNPQLERTRGYGSGVSPVGFQTDFLTTHRVQPFLSTNGGFVYFDQRVLSPQGSEWMYTIDYGAGINIFRKARQAVTIGYRYQHLSNADISHHNPGTDTNTFYVGISRFRTKHYR